MKYKKQHDEAQSELESEKLSEIKEAIKKRLRLIENKKNEIENLEKEISQLMEKGKITDLSTMIGCNEGLEDTSCMHITMNR